MVYDGFHELIETCKLSRRMYSVLITRH